ncbi:acireductone dioxygenase [Catenovulum sp. 2E275]|uniref:1,2-dihydroxy-3-keto-5-methylthiopentene dioxygenase n=1 Tax=Catenovulum sp. 2E275 TaxID=2980497 RepID=UPI0021CFB2B8|nr:acireductone dioxygenase [Catenovulum sp. 2E275]MCU4676040.1 acireductone dioxygenase [Catenovulum sp. 2E275]
MSQLTIYSDQDKNQIFIDTHNATEIQTELSKIGVQFERWQLEKDLAEDADNDTIIQAYQAEINRLVEERGYQSYDVVSMNPDHPQKAEFRKKFLDEHTHNEDEIRFFVRGQGQFVLHIGDKVYAILCEKDDLISVPAQTKHWFDMGPNPKFTAIRIFDNPEGWVAKFTGETIADQFPRLEN